MEDRIGTLGLVLNAIALFNTRRMDAALTHLRAGGFDMREEDVARLSPFVRHHIMPTDTDHIIGKAALPPYSRPSASLIDVLSVLDDGAHVAAGRRAGPRRTRRSATRRRGRCPVHRRAAG